MGHVRKVGVEEEMFLVDPRTGHIVPVSARAMEADRRQDEQHEQPEEL